MKKIVLLGGLLANFTFIHPCIAQHNAVKIDAFGAITGRLGLAYERSCNRHFSALLGFEKAKYASGMSNQQEVYKLSGYGFIPEVRYYPFTKNKPAPLGFFVGSAFRYASLTEDYMPTGVHGAGKVMNAGLNTGYKFNNKQVFIELLAGYGVGKVSGFDTVKRQQIDPFYSSSSLDSMKDFFRFEVSIGVVFPEIKPGKTKQ